MYHEGHTLPTHSVITVHTHHTCLTEHYMYAAMGGGRVTRAQSMQSMSMTHNNHIPYSHNKKDHTHMVSLGHTQRPVQCLHIDKGI